MNENTIFDQALSEAAGHYHAICAIRKRAEVSDKDNLVKNCLLALALCFFEEQAKAEMETLGKLVAAIRKEGE